MNNIFPHVSTAVPLRLAAESSLPCVVEESDSVLEHLAHELRQPLSVIESLAFYLELTSKDQGASVHLQQIQSMVRRAHRILAEAVGG